MNFILVVVLLITTPTTSLVETIEISGFKTESQCNREIARMRFSKLKSKGDVEIIFDHCTRTR